MTAKQLNGYKVEFYSEEEWNNYKVCGTNERNRLQIGIPMNCCTKELLNCEYVGLATEIPEELAERVVDESWGLPVTTYKDYRTPIEKDGETIFEAKDSFQTLSDLPYCVITKN